MTYTIYYKTLETPRIAIMSIDRPPNVDEVVAFVCRQYGHRKENVKILKVEEEPK